MSRAKIRVPVACLLLAVAVLAGAGCGARRGAGWNFTSLVETQTPETPIPALVLAVIDTSQITLVPPGFLGLDADPDEAAADEAAAEDALAVCVPMSAFAPGQTNGEPDAQSEYWRQWVHSLAGAEFFDAIALEVDAMPPTENETDSTPTANAIARFADVDLPNAIDRCARVFGNRPVWVADCPCGNGLAQNASSSSLAPLALAEIAIALGKKTPLVEYAPVVRAFAAAGTPSGPDTSPRAQTPGSRWAKVWDLRWLGLGFGRPSPLDLSARMVTSLFADNDRIVALDFHRPPRLSPGGHAIPVSEAAEGDLPALAALAFTGNHPRRVRVMVVNRSADPLAMRIVIDRARIPGRVKGRVLQCDARPPSAERDGASRANNERVRVRSRRWRKGRIELAPYSLSILDVSK